MSQHIDMGKVTEKHREAVKEAIEAFKSNPTADRFGYLMQQLALSYRVFKILHAKPIVNQWTLKS
ncbi:hypothetical protein phiPccP1_00005 [Pectobacterium phage phiPccP-1]|nr:hypothetical protein phiPccP1_00005 [Pectobacterium phage phiPccP-1]